MGAFVKVKETKTFQEICEFLEIDPVRGQNPPDVATGFNCEWRREYRKAGDIWRKWEYKKS